MAHTPEEAAWLLDLIAGEGLVTFQTFDDAKRGRSGLTRVLQGSIANHAETLAALNGRGAGVYFMVNGGDGKGRKSANVRTVRALFLDLDGAPLEPVLDGPLPPHAIVESSAGRFHAYWLATGVPLAEFPALQGAVASRFNGDPKVKDLPRVMRLPGFLHLKGEPFRTRVIELHRKPRYSADKLRGVFLPQPQAPAPRQRLPERIGAGERNQTLFGLARGFVNKGYALGDTNRRIQRINADRCDPPLCATEVDAIVASACAHGSNGYVAIPHAVVDSPEWKGLTAIARCIVLAAYRRFNGSNNGNISLPYTDFADELGNKAFYRHRNKAIRAGFLTRTSQNTYTRHGRDADLFQLAKCSKDTKG